MNAHGLLLAAGAGTRMGVPKALVDDWLARAVDALLTGGCDDVTVVLGADADRARRLLADSGTEARIVLASDWADGLAASLRAGLHALTRMADSPGVAVVTLVDLPDVGAAVVRRVLDRAGGGASLLRAAYQGTPGHPVLLGRQHWDGVLATAHGDRGARDYLSAQGAELVECGDLATGRDLDTPNPESPDAGTAHDYRRLHVAPTTGIPNEHNRADPPRPLPDP